MGRAVCACGYGSLLVGLLLCGCSTPGHEPERRSVDATRQGDASSVLEANAPWPEAEACPDVPIMRPLVCLPGQPVPDHYPVVFSGVVASIEQGKVCRDETVAPVDGLIVTLAPDGGAPIRIEMYLGPLALPLGVGDTITLAEYGSTFEWAPPPNYVLSRDGEVVLYVSGAQPSPEEPSLPFSLSFGSVTCSGRETCGTVTTYTLAASAGGETIELGVSEVGHVGAFDVLAGHVSGSEPNVHCGDWSRYSFQAAVVRRGDEAGSPGSP